MALTRTLMSKTIKSPSPATQTAGRQSPITSHPSLITNHQSPVSSPRQRFLDAARCKPVDRPPVWLMRQAGRALPEYRALKQKYTFVQLVQTPELATEVTLQPIRRFDFDAAILFSDILVVCRRPWARAINSATRAASQWISCSSPPPTLIGSISQPSPNVCNYVAQALRLIKIELLGKTALIGFAGSPWTLANFMLEGGGVKEYTKAKALFYSEPKLFSKLMEKLTSSITNFLQLQIDAGADAVQIFDSLGGLLSRRQFRSRLRLAG